jgi:hypothetical protein
MIGTGADAAHTTREAIARAPRRGAAERGGPGARAAGNDGASARLQGSGASEAGGRHVHEGE